jgi:hypothetical protein
VPARRVSIGMAERTSRRPMTAAKSDRGSSQMPNDNRTPQSVDAGGFSFGCELSKQCAPRSSKPPDSARCTPRLARPPRRLSLPRRCWRDSLNS